MAKKPPKPLLFPSGFGGPVTVGLKLPKKKAPPKAKAKPAPRASYPPGSFASAFANRLGVAAPKAKPAAKPKPKKIKRPAGLKGPIKQNVRPPHRPAASGSSGTAATIPPHATTGAVAPRSVGAPTSAAVARSTPVRTTTTTSSSTTKTKTLTDAELVAQQLDPLYLQNTQELDAARRAEAQREALIKSLTTGLQGDLSGVAGQVQGDYDRAFAATTGLASAGQQAISAGAPTQNAQMEADLRAIGAPQEQIDQLRAKNQAIYGGGAATIFGREGVLPGTDLASQGAAASAYARSLPAIAGMQGQAQLTAVIRAAQENEQKIADARALIAAKAPQVLTQIQNDRIAAEQKQAVIDMTAEKFGLTKQTAKFNQAVTKTKLGYEKVRLDQGTQKLMSELYGLDANGNLTLAGRRAATAEAKARTKKVSATQIKNWTQFADDAYHGVSPKQRYDSKTGTWVAQPGTGKPAVSYNAALKQLLSQGASLAQAQKLLNAHYARGEGGRPLVSVQGRNALSRNGMPLTHPSDAPNAAQRALLQQLGLWGK